MTGNIYTETVINEYLGLKEEIKGSSLLELKIWAEDILARWAEEEKTQRELYSVLEENTPEKYKRLLLTREIEDYKNIFEDALKSETAVNWVELFDDKPFQPFIFRETAPGYDKIAKELAVPERSLLENVMPSLKVKRLKRQEEARKIYSEQVEQFEKRKFAAQSAYESERTRHTQKQRELNDTIEKLRFAYETGRPYGIEGYTRIVLLKSVYPAAVKKDFEVYFDETTKTAVINYLLPDFAELPLAGDHDSDRAGGALPSENADFYRSVQIQIALRTIYEIFSSDYKKYIKNTCFNGWLISLEKSGVKEYAWCYTTCKVSCENFEKVDLKNYASEIAFQALGGITARSLDMKDAVEPLINVEA
ncbi:MAG: hypothetical protein ACYC0Q_12175 [Eubacteriales bacterium]